MTYDMFEFDFRNTRDPELHEGYVDFYMAGDFRYNKTGCPLAPDYLDFTEFIGEDEGIYSQIVLSESVATCWAN